VETNGLVPTFFWRDRLLASHDLPQISWVGILTAIRAMPHTDRPNAVYKLLAKRIGVGFGITRL